MSWEPSGLGQKILQQRYAFDGESWDDGALRLGKHVAAGEVNGKRTLFTDRFTEQIAENKFCPGGRIWYGAGRPKAQLLNCFVIPTGDSREAWGKTASDTIIISGLMGGVGMNMSPVRPRGSLIRGTGGTATGAVSLMQLINDVGNVIVGGGGRRMALMLCLDITHPDLPEFLEAKLDLGQLNNANISAGIPSHMSAEKFQAMVKNGETINFSFNGIESGNGINASDLWQKIVTHSWKNGEPGVLNFHLANQMNNIAYLAPLISTNPCLTGDALVAVADGRLHVRLDQIEDGTPVYCIDDSGDVVIRPIRHPRKTGFNVPILKVTLDDGSVHRVTPNHKFRLRDGSHLRADELRPGDSLFHLSRYIPDQRSSSRGDQYYTLGYGGGTPKAEHVEIAKYAYGGFETKTKHVHHKDGTRLNNTPGNLVVENPSTHLSEHSIGENNNKYINVSNSKLIEIGTRLTKTMGRRFSTNEWQAYAVENGLPSQFSDFRLMALGTIGQFSQRCAVEADLGLPVDLDPRTLRFFIKCVTAGYETFMVGERVYVRKICEVCGETFNRIAQLREQCICSRSCNNRRRVPTSSGLAPRNRERARNSVLTTYANKRIIKQTKQIECLLYLKQKNNHSWPQKKEWFSHCKFSGVTTEIGRRGSPFQSWEELKEAAAGHNTRVISIVPDGVSDVWNGTVDDFHNFFIGGLEDETPNGRKKFNYINNLQCGEIFLEEYGCCDLGALVLPRFVKDGSFDWDIFDESVRLGVRFLDNVLTVNHYPLLEIKNNCENVRRIGLGVMGLHSALLDLGLRYNSPEAFKFVDELFTYMKHTAYDASISLAIEKGPFHAYDQRFLESGFMKTMKRGIRNKIKEHGIRNCALMTIAPTGTTSIMCGASSGIEPLPPAVYWRTFYKSTADGKCELDRELVVEDYFEKYPKLVQSAIDIPIENHFEMQKICQKHIDNAVSKTINMPKDFPQDKFGDIWLEYLPHLKGTTVYRYGSRENEPISPVPQSEWKKLIKGENISHGMTIDERLEIDCPSGVCSVEGHIKDFSEGKSSIDKAS